MEEWEEKPENEKMTQEKVFDTARQTLAEDIGQEPEAPAQAEESEQTEEPVQAEAPAQAKESVQTEEPVQAEESAQAEEPAQSAAPVWAGQAATAYAQAVQGVKKAAKPKRGRRIFASVAAVIVVAGLSCGVAAFVMDSIFEKKNEQLRNDLEDTRRSYELRLEALENAMARQEDDFDRTLEAIFNRLNQQGTSQTSSQGQLSNGMLAPAQLYSLCVSSVVAISNQEASSAAGFTTVGTGSGFILTEDGYIVTNHHVVEGADKLLVTMSDGVEYEARLIGSDNINDVAVLKVEGKESFPAAQIGSSDALQIGDQVVAIGNPLGDLTATATVGYISGKDRPVNTDGIVIDMLQTDAAINSGNSGGPLFNMYGQVIGITTAKYSGTTSSGAAIEGIGFAIPIDDVSGIIRDLKEYGYITGGYLGVMVSSMDPTVAAIYNLPVGAFVRSVTEGSCAEKAGILPEDIITALGGYKVENLTDLTRALRNFRAGDSVSIEVYRGGATLTLTAVLDAKPVS
ncbi:MAG: trypsin-like peptidase domain-containing protein [Faecousia sp.]